MASPGLLAATGESVTFVRSDDTWHYRRGTNEPPVDWKTLPDAGLDASWLTGRGGFGYGDAAMPGENTTISGMTGVHSTLYLRKTFVVSTPPPSNTVLRLRVDYDDGFVAYLDGIELTRANLTNGPGSFVSRRDTTVTSHEASCCDAPTHPAEDFDLGLVGERLGTGEHVLAVIGVNGTLGSSDFHLFAGLTAEPMPEPPAGYVTGGTLASNTVWHATMGTIFVMSNLIVPTNVTLTVEPGVQVRTTNTASLRALGGVIDIRGEYTNRVTFTSFSGSNTWGGFSVTGTNAALWIRHAEIVGGPVKFLAGSHGLIEDSDVHHYYNGSDPIAGSTSAAAVTLRRSRFAFYHETLFQFTLMLVEDCLFEDATNPSSDCMDFDAAPAGSIVRRTTYRNGLQSNTDAIDIGSGGGQGSTGTLIYDCLMQNLTDKGVSIGEDSLGIVVSNCLMIATDRGVQVKDTCTATIANCTIVDSGIGIHCYEKIAGTGGGLATNTYNNILWDNGAAVSVEPFSTLVVHHTDLQNTNWPGDGNIDADPLFVSAAQGDYRLGEESPCRGTGLGGTDMGMHWPVGAFIVAPSNLVASAEPGGVRVRWDDSSATEAAFELERAVDGGPFARLLTLPANTQEFVDTSVASGQTNRYRVRGVSVTAQSQYSNEGEAVSQASPRILVEPLGRVAVPGADVAFSVMADGEMPLTFAWWHNGSPLATQVGSVLSLVGVQPVDAGDYVAIVSDASLRHATSAVARLTVTLPPELGLGAWSGGLATNGFNFAFTAPAGINYVVEGSTNLADWLPISTNATGPGVIEINDSASTNWPMRFYRTLLRP